MNEPIRNKGTTDDPMWARGTASSLAKYCTIESHSSGKCKLPACSVAVFTGFHCDTTREKVHVTLTFNIFPDKGEVNSCHFN